jgi:hypothetical protein
MRGGGVGMPSTKVGLSAGESRVGGTRVGASESGGPLGEPVSASEPAEPGTRVGASGGGRSADEPPPVLDGVWTPALPSGTFRES